MSRLSYFDDYPPHGQWFRLSTEGSGDQERVLVECLALPSPVFDGYMSCMAFLSDVTCEECPVGRLAERADTEPPSR